MDELPAEGAPQRSADVVKALEGMTIDQIVGESYDWTAQCGEVIVEAYRMLVEKHGLSKDDAKCIISAVFWAACHELGA